MLGCICDSREIDVFGSLSFLAFLLDLLIILHV